MGEGVSFRFLGWNVLFRESAFGEHGGCLILGHGMVVYALVLGKEGIIDGGHKSQSATAFVMGFEEGGAFIVYSIRNERRHERRDF